LTHVAAARSHDTLLGYENVDIEQTRAEATRALSILDEHLAECEFDGQRWLAAGHPTIADIACFPFVALSTEGGIERSGYHQLNRWLRRFRQLPGFIVMPGIPTI